MTDLLVTPEAERGRRRRLLFSAAMLFLVAAGIILAPVSAAEGPGYGGTADKLAVSWKTSPQPRALGEGAQAVAVPQERLEVQGFGFRGRSDIALRVGDTSPAAHLTDQTGSIALTVPVAGDKAAPGTSVIAIGLTPAGTRRVLIGAVPPRPSGVGPQQIVPMVLITLGAVVLLRSLRRRRSPVATALPETDTAQP